MTITKQLYDGSISLSFTEGTHRYRVTEPEELKGYKDGVTTPLRILNKPELMQWAANMAVDKFVEAYKLNPTLDEKQFKELCRQAKYAHVTYKDAAAEVGKRVHAWIEAHIAGSDGYIDESMAPAIHSFLDWEKEVKPHWLFNERLLYSKTNDYCGTVDGGAIINGLRTVVDFKTGKPDQEYDVKTRRYTGRRRARVDHFLQAGGYASPLIEEDNWIPEQLLVVYIPLDGSLYAFASPFVDFWRDSFTGVLMLHRGLKTASKLNQYEWS